MAVKVCVKAMAEHFIHCYKGFCHRIDIGFDLYGALSLHLYLLHIVKGPHPAHPDTGDKMKDFIRTH